MKKLAASLRRNTFLFDNNPPITGKSTTQNSCGFRSRFNADNSISYGRKHYCLAAAVSADIEDQLGSDRLDQVPIEFLFCADQPCVFGIPHAQIGPISEAVVQ